MDEHGTKCSTYFSCHSIFRRLVAFIYFFIHLREGSGGSPPPPLPRTCHSLGWAGKGRSLELNPRPPCGWQNYLTSCLPECTLAGSLDSYYMGCGCPNHLAPIPIFLVKDMEAEPGFEPCSHLNPKPEIKTQTIWSRLLWENFSVSESWS